MELVLKIVLMTPCSKSWAMNKSDVDRASEKPCPSHCHGSFWVGSCSVRLDSLISDSVGLGSVGSDSVGLGWAGLGHITLHYVTVTLCHSLYNNTQNLALSVFFK